MSFPGEELVTAALEKFADGVIQKMDAAEERRNREFSYKLKELEYYKGNYDKEIRSIFDRWFDYLHISLMITNKHVDSTTKQKYEKKQAELLKPEKFIKLKIDTIKYCGTETGKVLAVFSQITYNSDSFPQFANVYVVCWLLSTLKKEILGQEMSPNTILQILLTDFSENADVINEGRSYVEEVYRDLFISEEDI